MELDPFAPLGWSHHASARLRLRFPLISEWYATSEIRAAITVGRWARADGSSCYECWTDDDARRYIVRRFGRALSVLTVYAPTSRVERSGAPLRAGYAPAS